MRKEFFLIFLLSGVTFTGLIKSQIQLEWASRYNGTGNSVDEALVVKADNSGNVYVTGFSFGSTSNKDYITIKYNPAGDTAWVRRYNGPGNSIDVATALAIDDMGNVYVTGSSVDTDLYTDYTTIKYNSVGDVVWVERYSGPGSGDNTANAIAVDNLYNVYVTGSSTGVTSGRDYATVEYNSAGIQQWASRYDGPGNSVDQAYAIAVDGGAVFVTGESRSGKNSGTEDYLTIKYNTAGDSVWVKRYNGTGNFLDKANSITFDLSGNVYITGISAGSGTDKDYATIKYNISGVEQWVSRYNGPGNYLDEAYSLAVDNSGNVYVTGTSVGSTTMNDYATVKYNSIGEQQWVQRYHGPLSNSAEWAYSLILDISGNVYVTGVGTGDGTSGDYVTIKYDASGSELWLHRYNSSDNKGDASLSIALDVSGNVYVTGRSDGGASSNDYLTIKYSQVAGIRDITTEIPDAFGLMQNFPNPFNPVTSIRFQIPKSSFVILVVFDINGKEIETLINQNLSAGTYGYDWDASKYASGIYFYKLQTLDDVDVEKMVLMK